MFGRESLITRLLSRYSFPHDIEILFIELNLRKKKWLICCCYNPHKNLTNYHLQELAKGIQIYFDNCDDILLTRDFHAEVLKQVFLLFVNSMRQNVLSFSRPVSKALQIHRV